MPESEKHIPDTPEQSDAGNIVDERNKLSEALGSGILKSPDIFAKMLEDKLEIMINALREDTKRLANEEELDKVHKIMREQYTPEGTPPKEYSEENKKQL